MSGHPAEMAIRRSLHDGQLLSTPSRAAPFIVSRIDDGGVTMLFGRQQTPTHFGWPVWESVLAFLGGSGWVELGGRFATQTAPGSLDSYLKNHMKRATAGWVAVVLEAAGLVEIDRRRPARVRVNQPLP